MITLLRGRWIYIYISWFLFIPRVSFNFKVQVRILCTKIILDQGSIPALLITWVYILSCVKWHKLFGRAACSCFYRRFNYFFMTFLYRYYALRRKQSPLSLVRNEFISQNVVSLDPTIIPFIFDLNDWLNLIWPGKEFLKFSLLIFDLAVYNLNGF